MQNKEIVSQLPVNPSEVIYAITMETLLAAIVHRLGAEALKLTEEDLYLAREEVLAAISHNLDERDYIDMGLDAWEITRNL
ncbi:MAG: hypothetical protein KKA54_16115 [Proteobacteria bacterium]|nr:hypothetical protein [Pseudomonadota bacterium]MBU0967899.1 hypothetical protein [Pseudomonadota bacterium]